MLKTLFFIVGFLLFTNTAFGCSLVTGLLLADRPILVNGKLFTPAPKPADYVFTGEVVEIVSIAKLNSVENKTVAEGLRIKVVDNINSVKPASFYEVLPLSVYADCSLQGQTDLTRIFPVGSQVRVIAQEATVYKKLTVEDSTIRLETSIMNGGNIVRNDLTKSIEASANSLIDYNSFLITKPSTRAEETQFYQKLSLLEFELQKDLANLSKAKTEGERLTVMQRLVDYPLIYAIAYHTMAQAYLKDSKKRRSLEAKWEDRKKQQMLENQRLLNQKQQ